MTGDVASRVKGDDMQISYSEEKRQYEVTVSPEEKTLCSAMLESYGFRWSQYKGLYYAAENERSNKFINMVRKLKGADLDLPKRLELPACIRNFFERGNYNFADIAILSGVTEDEVKQKAIEIYTDAELRNMGLYEKIIDREKEWSVMGCIAMFPATEDKAIKYLLKEQGIMVSDSCLMAIRKKHGYTVQKIRDAEPVPVEKNNIKRDEQKRYHKTGENLKTNAESKQRQTGSDEKYEKVSVSDLKKQYYEEHQNCTSMHVREAMQKGEFDIPLIAEKAGVKEETVKCKIVDMLSKEALQQYGFFDDFIRTADDENAIISYVKQQSKLPETSFLKKDLEKALGKKYSLSTIKAVLKKNDIAENVPDMVYRPKVKGR